MANGAAGGGVGGSAKCVECDAGASAGAAVMWRGRWCRFCGAGAGADASAAVRRCLRAGAGAGVVLWRGRGSVARAPVRQSLRAGAAIKARQNLHKYATLQAAIQHTQREENLALEQKPIG